MGDVTTPTPEMQDRAEAPQEQAQRTGQPIYPTDHDKPVPTLMDASAYGSIAEPCDDLYEREMRRLEGIERGHRQVMEGKVVAYAQVRAHMVERWDL